MSDCICGARGIDLQSHECIPSLRDLVVFHARANLELKREIQRLQSEISALQPQSGKLTCAGNIEFARVRELQEHVAQLQKHLDEWRGYAYGNRGRPMDYIDSPDNKQEPTLIDRLQFDLAETQKREKRLEQNLGLCMAEFNRANDALDKIMQDSFKGSGR